MVFKNTGHVYLLKLWPVDTVFLETLGRKEASYVGGKIHRCFIF